MTTTHCPGNGCQLGDISVALCRRSTGSAAAGWSTHTQARHSRNHAFSLPSFLNEFPKKKLLLHLLTSHSAMDQQHMRLVTMIPRKVLEA
jgi:hypothetical protein